jgi:hypothetical protein
MTSQNTDLSSWDNLYMTYVFDTPACNFQNIKEISNSPAVLFRRNIFCIHHFFFDVPLGRNMVGHTDI